MHSIDKWLILMAIACQWMKKKMSLTKKSDGSYQFTIEMQAKLRNDFETPMLVAFISVGQAIKHQENFAKKKSTYKPVIPNDTEVTVITKISKRRYGYISKGDPRPNEKIS